MLINLPRKYTEAEAAPQPEKVTGLEKCESDGGTCGLGGHCDICPHIAPQPEQPDHPEHVLELVEALKDAREIFAELYPVEREILRKIDSALDSAQ